MAQYTVRVYFQTGFNSVNIPDGPAMLNGNEQTVPPTTEFSYLDFPSLDLNQERFLPLVKIRTSWDVIKNADYCRIGDWYYFVNSIRMSSGDVAELSLTPDFLTSLGGVSQLVILDGVTDRVHVTDDAYGKYTGDDPYMNPAYDMEVASYTHKIADTMHTFLETTLNLNSMGSQKQDNDTPALTAVSTKDGVDYPVTYPIVTMLTGKTTYNISMGGSSAGLMSVEGQGVYKITDPATSSVSAKILDGVSQARSLGVEESISGQYAIPSTFVGGATIANAGFQPNLTGQSGTITPTGVNFIYGTANNKRVFYGSQTPYTLATASGSTLSAKAEEIFSSGATAPSVMYFSDPRRTGKPYYRFAVLNGVSAASDPYDFFRGCISGTQWQSVPMVMTEKSGGLLDQVSHNASVMKRDMADAFAAQKYDEGSAKNKLGAVSDVIQNTLDFKLGSAFTSAISRGTADFDRNNEYNRYLEQSAMERALEEQQFGISQNVYSPTVSFPADPALFSEVTRNGFGVYRTIYKAADITRIDKILTAYGYKHTKILEPSDFTNRTYFNYVKASVSIGNIPRWWANGIAAQLAGGVRVWHVRPSATYYSSNPVVSANP